MRVAARVLSSARGTLPEALAKARARCSMLPERDRSLSLLAVAIAASSRVAPFFSSWALSARSACSSSCTFWPEVRATAGFPAAA
eukprot:scaffold340929_cov51-Prasinocladus_malaysianus.AAC.1